MSRVLVLTAVTGSNPGKRYTLTGQTNTIGSGPGNDAVIFDRQLQSRHAEVRQMLDRWFISPSDSLARLSVNGLPVTNQSRLNTGDNVTIGSVTYRVDFEELQEREVGAPVMAPSNGAIPRLGDYFVRRGIMTHDQIRRVAQRQNELQYNGRRTAFGQIAYELGFITRLQLDRALSDQASDFNERFRD